MRLAGAVILALAGGIAQQVEAGAPQPLVLEPVKQLKFNAQWPGEVDREAYVLLEFDVLADGKVANIIVVDEGFHEKRFVNEAIKALERSQWEPQRINGVAVDTPGLRKGIRFGIHDMQPGVTQDFHDEARKVDDLIRKGDYAGGEFHAEWMLAEKVTLNYEYALLQANLARAYAGQGKLEDAVRKVTKATARPDVRPPEFLRVLDVPPPNKASSYLLDKELVVQLLGLRMHLLAAQGLALEALQAYYELAGLEPPKPDDQVSVLAERLTAAVRGNGAIRASIEIGAGGGWQQHLSRRKFVLEKVRGGSISSLYLLCEGGSRQFNYVPGEEWSVPEGLGRCKARVGADPGTTFDFVELPAEP